MTGGKIYLARPFLILGRVVYVAWMLHIDRAGQQSYTEKSIKANVNKDYNPI